MSRQSAYKLRNRLKGEPFDIAWRAAFRLQYDALAEAVIERAIHGVEVPHFHKGELIHTSRRYDERATVALLALRERLRDFGVLKALGLTPRQVASTLVSPYALVALLAGVVAIPVGVALYVAVFHAAGGDGDPVIAPWPWLALVPVATVLLVVAATSVPARIAAHAPAADVLRAE